MKVTEEQLREIGRIAGQAWAEASYKMPEAQLAMGRAAFEASVRIASDLLGKVPAINYETSEPAIFATWRGFDDAVSRLRSLTEPERDEAREAVRGKLNEWRSGDGTGWGDVVGNVLLDGIVAAVRKADAK